MRRVLLETYYPTEAPVKRHSSQRGTLLSDPKPRVRVRAQGQPVGSAAKAFVGDSYQNFAAQIGLGSATVHSGSSYGFNPISRKRNLLDWAYRGSWLVKQVVDAVADDMTRAQIHIDSDDAPDRIDRIYQHFQELEIWQRLNSTIKWSRLYGGAIALLLIDGQNPSTPFRPESVRKGQFRGLLVLDRWMVNPHLDDYVSELGPDFGKPRYYDIVMARGMGGQRVHYTRCLRIDGIELPFWQKMSENEWGLSVIEPLFDRLLAFDSSSSGAAQMVYRAHLRNVFFENFREVVATGGQALEGVKKQIDLMRLMQTNEGISVFDATDRFETTSYNFGGVSDLITQFAQQLSGASQIPLTRLFGQAPAGLNATGESDMRNYYDSIAAQQEARLRRIVHVILDVTYRSLFDHGLPNGFGFGFNPLWQLSAGEKLDKAAVITNAISGAMESGVIDRETAMKELRQTSHTTGVWSNITDEDIEAAGKMERQLASAQAALSGTPVPPGAVSPKVGEESSDPLAHFRSTVAHPGVLEHFSGGQEDNDPLGHFKAMMGSSGAVDYFKNLPGELKESALDWWRSLQPDTARRDSLADPLDDPFGHHNALETVRTERPDENSPSWTESPDLTEMHTREDVRQSFVPDPHGDPADPLTHAKPVGSGRSR